MRRVAAILSVVGCFALFHSTQAYTLNGHRWPDGTEIAMHLSITRAPIAFQDGSASWNDSAADALSLWNQQIGRVHFAATAPANLAASDGVNTVTFSRTIYGQAFPARVLAVTTYFPSTGTFFTEADVIFNDALRWDSYGGPIQYFGAAATYDFHRVALHEFGHVLGLDHPDEAGQSVDAIMNSIITDRDTLALDDIQGGVALYGTGITSPKTASVQSGAFFSYRITASNNPTSFGATNLPPGLTVDSTGLISGRCPSSGTFTINLSATGSYGTAAGVLQLTVVPLPLTNPSFPSPIIGTSFTFAITAGNNPVAYSATGLPPGLTIDAANGIVSGMPTATGIFTVTLRATGATSEASATYTVEVKGPSIVSALTPPAIELGNNFYYKVLVAPQATAITVSQLPLGFFFEPGTSVISGVGQAAGNYQVLITAQTNYGTASATLTISILQPHLNLSNLPAASIGQSYSSAITASNNPSSFSATILPAGLQLNSATGVISGTPTLSGSYSFTVTAAGAVGDAIGVIYLTVSPAVSYTPYLTALSIMNGYPRILFDSRRSRFYVLNAGRLAVFDSVNLTFVQDFPLSGFFTDAAISSNGDQLFIPAPYLPAIYRIDLDNLVQLPSLVPSYTSTAVRQGADGLLYTVAGNSTSFNQLDPATGATVRRWAFGQEVLAWTMSPDRQTIFISRPGSYTSVIGSYRINPGDVPSLVQEVTIPGTVRLLSVSPDGLQLAASAAPASTKLLSTHDLTLVQDLPAPLQAFDLVFSLDSSLLLATTNSLRADVITIATRSITQTITLSSGQTAAGFINREQGQVLIANGAGAIFSYALKPLVLKQRNLLNVSTRLRAQTGDDVLIGGFIITGDAAKNLVVRATGPSLPVSGKLADPQLELHAADGSLVAANDNWNEHRMDILASGLAPLDEHEAALSLTLNPGAYTVIVRGLAQTSGVGLVEVYDLSPDSNSKLANISTRGKVETGDNVMIGGFIIGGMQPTKAIVRALGPSLVANGVGAALRDTTLELFDSQGTKLDENDNWQSDHAAEIEASTLAPTDPRESAILRTFAPGGYTAIVRGAGNTTGVALVEVYNLEP